MEPSAPPSDAEREQAVRLLDALREVCVRDAATAAVATSWANEAVATRYLRARNHSHSAALKMLCRTVEWRAASKPQEARCPRCCKNPTAHSMRWVGFDAIGRPVCYSSFEHALDRWNAESNQLHVTHLLESMSARLQQLGRPLEKWVLFVDFKGFALADNNPITGQKVISLLQGHYPERLGLVLLYDAPWLFSACWKGFKLVMDERTTKKIRFLSSSDKSPDTWDFATPELAAWLQAEIEDVRRPRPGLAGPRKYWLPAQAEPHDDSGQRVPHDSRGTASWLSDAHHIPSPADFCAEASAGTPT
jgi:hypothetical protein